MQNHQCNDAALLTYGLFTLAVDAAEGGDEDAARDARDVAMLFTQYPCPADVPGVYVTGNTGRVVRDALAAVISVNAVANDVADALGMTQDAVAHEALGLAEALGYDAAEVQAVAEGMLA